MKLWMAILASAAVLTLVNPPYNLGGVFASLLVSCVLGLILDRCAVSGPVLVPLLGGFHFVMSALTNIPEAVVFDVLKPAAAPIMLCQALVSSIGAVLVLVEVAGRLRHGLGESLPAVEPVRGLLWKLLALPVVFVLCYFVAGMIIFPFVKDYYAGRSMPQPSSIVAMASLRSLAMVAAAYPVLTVLRSRREGRWILAIALPVFGVIAPLLPATEMMPEAVRMVHLMEMVPYYALFGFLIAAWLSGPAAEHGGLDHSAALPHSPAVG